MHAFCVPKPFCSARKRQGSILLYNNHNNKKAPRLLSHHAFRTEFPQGWRAQARPCTLTLTFSVSFSQNVCVRQVLTPNPKPSWILIHTHRKRTTNVQISRERREVSSILVPHFLNSIRQRQFSSCYSWIWLKQPISWFFCSGQLWKIELHGVPHCSILTTSCHRYLNLHASA